jgi:hypothetical protein
MRMAFFVWMIALGKIVTKDSLWKRHDIVMDWCCMCKKSKEFIDHLILNYEVARMGLGFPFLGIEWVKLQQVVKLLACWRC